MTGYPVQFLVMAKAPRPGRVKTRLCPPFTPVQAATVAAAALADTLAVVGTVPAARRTVVLDGQYGMPAGWRAIAQRGAGLGDRLAHAYADTARDGVGSLLVGMDTPQLTRSFMHDAARLLSSADAVLGPAYDGGWWALGLRDPSHGAVLREVPMSTSDTGAETLRALRRRGLRVALLPELRDVDTAADAYAVVAQCPPGSRFVAAVAQYLPARPALAARPALTARSAQVAGSALAGRSAQVAGSALAPR